eukprot:CCRYP_010852-RA/>CCRYP_010852-RA protein AED:0.35 eAED:0.35 QI:176/0.66/0.75/1/1/1/4/0/470
MENEQLDSESSGQHPRDANVSSLAAASGREYILNADGTQLHDHKGAPITVDKFLSTKPLRGVISSRQGPGGKKLDYMPGEVVTQTLNEAFGYDGWCLEVKNTMREEIVKDDKGRYIVAYNATVRITHRRSGVFRVIFSIVEDCGAGDAVDKSLGTASGNALKSAITDAMKRAARHFGEKLGNALYHGNFSSSNAPVTLRDALENLDVQRANSRFGFDKDRANFSYQNNGVSQQPMTNQHQASSNTQQTRKIQNNQTCHSSQQTKSWPVNSFLTQQTQQATTPSMSNQGSTRSPSFGLPMTTNDNSTNEMNFTAAAAAAAAAYVTPYSAMNPLASNAASKIIDSNIHFRSFNATPARNLSDSASGGVNNGGRQTFDYTVGQETPNPNLHSAAPTAGGLNLPPRQGTSQGQISIANNDNIGAYASSMLAMTAGLPDGRARELKRKSESLDGFNVGPATKIAASGVKNPYNAS